MGEASGARIADNETRRFIADAVADAARNVRLDVNRAFETLQAVLIQGVPGEVEVGFTIGEESTQGNGVVAGGALASMLDGAMAVAVLSRLQPGQTCATMSLTVNMLSGAQFGDFVVQASVDKLGGRAAFAQARLYSADRRLIANATSSLAVISVR